MVIFLLMFANYVYILHILLFFIFSKSILFIQNYTKSINNKIFVILNNY